MIIKTFLKQPAEIKDYDVDYSLWLTPMQDTLDNVEAKVECLDDPDDISMVVERVSITTTLMKVWVKGGTDGYAYKVTLYAVSTGGRLDESELIFAVGEI